MADAIRRAERRLSTRVHGALQTIGRDVASAIVTRLGLRKVAVDAMANAAERNPSVARRRAGNYRMGHLRIGPLEITIENPAGSRRRADRPDWPRLPHHYGYLRRTEGADGDQVDCFVRVGTDDAWRGPVFVIDQLTPEGKFDEHKCLLGWRTRGRAVRDYLRAYQPGWRVGPVTRLTFDDFVDWVRSGDTRLPIGKASDDDWASEVTDAEWSELADVVSPALARQLRAAGIEELSAIGWGTSADAVTGVNARAAEYAADRSAELVTGVADATRDQLRALVAQAIDENWSGDDLASAIEGSYSFSADRAETIARTELVGAYTQGNAEVGRIAGAVGKRWVLGSEHGAGESDECDDNADDGVIAFEEAFSSGDDFPPAHPRCVCSFESVYPGDPGADDLEEDET